MLTNIHAHTGGGGGGGTTGASYAHSVLSLRCSMCLCVQPQLRQKRSIRIARRWCDLGCRNWRGVWLSLFGLCLCFIVLQAFGLGLGILALVLVKRQGKEQVLCIFFSPHTVHVQPDPNAHSGWLAVLYPVLPVVALGLFVAATATDQWAAQTGNGETMTISIWKVHGLVCVCVHVLLRCASRT